MSKSLGYYASGSAIDRIIENYGDLLEDLTVGEKLLLMSAISGFLSCLPDTDEDVPEIVDFVSNSSDECPTTDDVYAIAEILDESPNEGELKGFLLALANQVYELPVVFNDNTYTAAYETLTEDGVEADLAKRAARIVASDHACLTRTEKQQEVVKQAWKQFNGYYVELDEVEELLQVG